MIDCLPQEIITIILNELENNSNFRSINNQFFFINMDINTILNLKRINLFFKHCIENISSAWLDISKNNKNLFKCIGTNTVQSIKVIRSQHIDILCKKKTSIHTFKWIFQNNLSFSLQNIKTLIINNRIDVLKLGFQYEEFLNTIYNRFHICQNNDIISLSQHNNPILIAVEYDRLHIIRLLLESSSFGNPFLDQITSILDICIKYTNKNLLNYLILNHYERISQMINNRFSLIILRFNNIEDILFYLIINKRVHINKKVLHSIIIKNYKELFIYCFTHFTGTVNNSDLILKSVEYNSIDIFKYLLDNSNYINKHEFSSTFFSKKIFDPLMIHLIIDDYLYLVPKKYKLINISLKYEIPNEKIFKLIDEGYFIQEEDIIHSIQNKNIELARYLINNYNV
tara:strand:+ start:4181 stop:5377 length:1197 start_codon:yes stop_codon:yes gene_type:complete